MANIEKHLKRPMDQIDQADFSGVPTCARAPHLIGRYIKNRKNDGRSRVSGEERPQPVILRLENLPATPRNLERIRERVRLLNRLLADSGTPFRLRVVERY
ncbi:MAG: hypothetical protein M1541_07910 [Acidobacteria bacterium]|nr:hypothetical protein [Acidobacteriota bacterium]